MLVYLIMTHFNFISCVCFFMAKAGVTSHPLKAKSHNYCKSQVYYILAPHSRRVGLINQINVVLLHKLTFIKDQEDRYKNCAYYFFFLSLFFSLSLTILMLNVIISFKYKSMFKSIHRAWCT